MARGSWHRHWLVFRKNGQRVWRRKWGVNGVYGPARGFKWGEVRSRDGKHIPRVLRPNSVKLGRNLNRLRRKIKRKYKAKRVAIVVNSWYRSVPHNHAVGGASNSQHLYGKAVDIAVFVKVKHGVILEVEPSEVASIAKSIRAFRNGGIGTYRKFVHLDTREYPARWNE